MKLNLTEEQLEEMNTTWDTTHSMFANMSIEDQKGFLLDIVKNDEELKLALIEELSDKRVAAISCSDKLVEDYNDLKSASLKLAEGASYVIREYDGVHRLSRRVADLYNVLAGIHSEDTK